MEIPRTLLPKWHLRGASSVIFVTVGNATTGFRRLLEAVDELAEAGAFGNDYVFIQSGNNSYFKPKYCEHTAFITMELFTKSIQEANMVISHGGAGTLMHVLRAGKVPVVMPRRKHYGEIVDDHQNDLVRSLAFEGRVIPAYETNDLARAIAFARSVISPNCPPSPSHMISLVCTAIHELIGDEGKAKP
jgi:UDP-N-acetylglucosamine transferase subunit ALG13